MTQDEITTPITCAGEACPRTPGFWTQQCAQKGNGSTKFTKTQVTNIASCIDDRVVVLQLVGMTSTSFCITVNPPDMNQRVQAKRQFATLLANFCTDQLNLQPSQGGEIFLPGDTPVHCNGFTATTISQLIDEVDALLTRSKARTCRPARSSRSTARSFPASTRSTTASRSRRASIAPSGTSGSRSTMGDRHAG